MGCQSLGLQFPQRLRVSHTLSEGQLTGVSVNDCLVSAFMRIWDMDLMPRLTTEAILESNREVEARVAEIRGEHAGRPVWLYLGSSIHFGRLRLGLYFFSCRRCSEVIQTRGHHKGWIVQVPESRGWLVGSEHVPPGNKKTRFKNKQRCLAFKFYGYHVVEESDVVKAGPARMMVRGRGIVSGRSVAVRLKALNEPADRNNGESLQQTSPNCQEPELAGQNIGQAGKA